VCYFVCLKQEEEETGAGKATRQKERKECSRYNVNNWSIILVTGETTVCLKKTPPTLFSAVT